MNGQKAKLFRYLFNHPKDYRRFKKAYTRASPETRLATIAMAKKIRATGPVKNMEVREVSDNPMGSHE